MLRINALTIAGTDPSGGAGIQADLKTFSALEAYGTSVVTALVAQNTCGVRSVSRVPTEFVREQLLAVLDDVRIDTLKLGMLHNAEIIRMLVAELSNSAVPWRVLDTVMLAKSGDPLLDPQAVALLRDSLLPEVSLITPNLPEAAALLGCREATSEKEMLNQANQLLSTGCQAVLIKGGHLRGEESPDWLVSQGIEQRFTTPRIDTRNTHGTGCSLSAALAALRPRYPDWPATVSAAKQWLSGAIAAADSLQVGQGNGPVHHFYRWW
ncbi:bifunctional hydroxymethylpyrimidine kinase/phosphomethylpyrimidine kinase [Tatumella citrea]|uniref:hydroxymethylpyrimidine kinase n=1 Tax=Tatumella citrea TaxID=53336 RepID=A0A1Y0LKS0_TATCI|nr:bifunctional hydroxymethylpyrimidine kinase/phosphomethylpyrimidine kinase [Tatumella citrea]ARU94645.1 bifunctional hydroxymethylpyrimidine kinase/phosphomethylpyrimidine kinase [Tatumella citrea]ARU98682.1 bifunctional hydroxymethylpyrimidine kinase/phosphomethylpyrimidine kinase [Tatumella citrea]